MRGLTEEKDNARRFKRLGVLCLFCFAELKPNASGRKIEICGSKGCKREYIRAYKRDYRKDVFQDPMRGNNV